MADKGIIPLFLAWAVTGNYVAFQIAEDREFMREFAGYRGLLAIIAALWPLWLLWVLMIRLREWVK